MLELKNITKVYETVGETVNALKGIDVTFRESEFVSVLGPSGCGKTTLLNIMGGLDKYSSGDLIINGISTKDYTDRDWDTYRNHSVGFVFQNYNLIPHQTVLQNVELALTLSGISKSERQERAKIALERVGLGSQLKKKPAEMSGGQMQRVAIARAIVNDPEIILADEPTGALDSETSIQVMEILKEISNERLVIMVTHNPELAKEYSTRIIRMLDGILSDDSNPITADETVESLAANDTKKEAKTNIKTKNKTKKTRTKSGKSSMSLKTSFGLSLKNLFTKKGRTALVSFAGSIGIIGIALIYAVSQGATAYINSVQEDTLSSYPLTIEAQHVDLTSLLETFMGKAKSVYEHGDDAVYQKAMMYDLVNSMNSLEEKKNDLKSFKKYIEEKRADKESESGLADSINGVQYSYDLDLQIYTQNVDGDIIVSDTQSLMQELMLEYLNIDFSSMLQMQSQSIFGSTASAMQSSTSLWQEMLKGDDDEVISQVLKQQYDVVYGTWPKEYNEVMLFVDENNEIDDLTLYALGLTSKEEIDNLMKSAVDRTKLDYEEKEWSYEEICGTEFRTVLNSNCYSYDEQTGNYIDLRDTSAGLKYLYDNGIKLKVTGVARPSEDSVSTMITGSIGYTTLLTEKVIEESSKSEAVSSQKENPEKDIFTGLPFKDTNNEMSSTDKAQYFRTYIDSLDTTGKAEAYVKIMSIPSDDETNAAVSNMLNSMTREDMEAAISDGLTSQSSLNTSEIADYVKDMSDDELKNMFSETMAEQYKTQYSEQVASSLQGLSDEEKAGALTIAMQNYTDENLAQFYDNVLEFSESTYEDNLKELGCIDLDSPSAINLYAATFADKDVIEDAIEEYNSKVDDMSEITYTDYVGLIMSSVNTIINAITYVLIAFVAVSLIVSSIMIGVITLISVQERTKEIGILRAIGASKKNISSMFNAETVLIGLASGIIGVAVTYLLCIPINAILHHLTGINNINAFLPVPVACILIIISMILTLIAGIIPSRSASKKDPVVALRTE